MDREGKRGDKKERENRPRRLSCHVHVAASSHRLCPLGSFFPVVDPPLLVQLSFGASGVHVHHGIASCFATHALRDSENVRCVL